jgi:hypothetical protein
VRQGGQETSGLVLGNWPVPLPRNWKSLVNESQTEAELDALRHAVHRGCLGIGMHRATAHGKRTNRIDCEKRAASASPFSFLFLPFVLLRMGFLTYPRLPRKTASRSL